MHERHLEVRRTARYYTTGDVGPATRSLWFVLHGYRQLASRFLRRFEPIATATRTIVAPEALSRFYIEEEVGGPHGPESRVGATWMTREDRLHEIDDYVSYLDALHAELTRKTPDAHVVVLGFSQGSATAGRWATLGNARIDRLVLWAGALPHDLDETSAAPKLRALRPVFVVGQQDRWAGPDSWTHEEARLRALDIPTEMITHEEGHVIERAALDTLATRIDGE